MGSQPRAVPRARLASTGAVCQGGRVDNSAPPRVAVIGGGIAGLAAAFFLREEPVAVTVLEGSPRLGGKLAVSDIAGMAVDEGAEALLARRPEGTGLIRAAGLVGQLVAPGTTSARIWSLAWWPPCSGGSTPGGRRTCRSRRPSPPWRRSPASTRRSPKRRLR